MSHAWMPLYVGDYLSKTRRLSPLEHGVYMLLIMEYWQSRGLPDDDAQLARIVGMTDKEWRRVRPAMLPFFNDGWQHDRIDDELAKADAKHERRVQAGSNGGKAKANHLAMLPAMLPQKPSIALASSSQSQSQEDASHLLTREQIDDIEAQVRQAAGLENDTSPGLLVVGPILDLIAKGYTLNGDILPAASKIKATGKHPSTWAYLVKMVESAKAETAAVKPAAPVVKPVAFLSMNDPRWPIAAAAFEKACGLVARASETEGGERGRRFPVEMIPTSLKRAEEAA